ncbi:MAG: RNA methyltransferase [Prevotellaceae bacterium]|jgi:TrmH family RNA methyltransferase|nr:RNA methyltransferase [Prevotellaceae bacterium]
MGNISRQEKKRIASLAVKKYRDRERLFVVEGEKSVQEFLVSPFKIRKIYYTRECDFSGRHPDTAEITADEMRQISNLKTASPVLAVVEIPSAETLPRNGLILALDDVQDPGNLGTIIRLADWFGIDSIVCSLCTADAYGPKTVQATMGSLTRVNIVYADLYLFLKPACEEIPVYGTFLEGENIYRAELSDNGIIVMGNEGKGISHRIAGLVSRKLLIPAFGHDNAESLNVAVAAAVTCSEFRRRNY